MERGNGFKKNIHVGKCLELFKKRPKVMSLKTTVIPIYSPSSLKLFLICPLILHVLIH